jgi:hypothetical protein
MAAVKVRCDVLENERDRVKHSYPSDRFLEVGFPPASKRKRMCTEVPKSARALKA